MVDLVKIRRKAREKKEAEEGKKPRAGDAPAEARPSEESPKPKAKRRTRRAKPAPQDDSVKEQTAEKKAGKSEELGQARGETKVAAATQAVDTHEPATALDEPAKKSPDTKVVKPKRAAEPVHPTSDDAEARQGSTEASKPEPDETAITEGVDSGVMSRLEKFKKEAGKRRGWFAETETQKTVAVETPEERRELELLRFRLAGEEYAVDIDKIVEIVPPRGTTRVPNADGSIVGIMSLRGTIVTVFDLRRKLGHPPVEDGQGIDPRLIVVERAGETAGFLVDRVSRVVKLDPSELESHPVVSAAEQSDYVGGVFQASDGLVILLDLERILASQG